VEIFTGARDESERVKCTNTADEIIAAKNTFGRKRRAHCLFSYFESACIKTTIERMTEKLLIDTRWQ
jgi:hypothetical protein